MTTRGAELRADVFSLSITGRVSAECKGYGHQAIPEGRGVGALREGVRGFSLNGIGRY